MRRIGKLSHALLSTLSYADVFSFPLTLPEIKRYAIGVTVNDFGVKKTLGYLSRQKATNDKYFFLNGRKEVVVTRLSREVYSAGKWEIAAQVAWWLSLIPTIELVGVTGALAMENAGAGDDIDLFLIVRKNTLWISRFLAIIMVELVSKRRRPQEKEVANSICLNMFVTTDGLAVLAEERDLYTAHEVLQMVPLWDHDGIYEQFIDGNKWVKKFLPNYWKEVKTQISNLKIQNKQKYKQPVVASLVLSFEILLLRLCEPLAKILELRYMENKRTSEVVGEAVLRFHPHDTRAFVQQELRKRLGVFNIPLDKVFVGSIE